MEFGVRWGRHLALFNSFRAFFEPYNFYRKIIGFDTFEGFKNSSNIDGNSDRVYDGAMSVSKGYENFLSSLMKIHELETPMSHISKIELHKGNAPETLKKYLKNNPQTIISLAYFDMDIYKPTKECLEIIKPYLVKGSIIVFDELTHPQFPGETIALKETMNLLNYKVKKISNTPYPVYITI